VLLAKSLMWAFSLGSGTSGGVLAPLLMIGSALGALAATVAHVPAETEALWALAGMGAMLSGSLGAPLTAIVFSIELTHSLPALLPLTRACIMAHTVTALVMPRSILTEKIARRGFHLTREYGVDPLEMVSVVEVLQEESALAAAPLPAQYSFGDETCRQVAEEMAVAGLSRSVIVDRTTHQRLGIVTLENLLVSRRRAMSRECDRQRVFGRLRSSKGMSPVAED
jgi:CIC family chloride channel protein